MESKLLSFSQSPSLMYQLCNVKNAGQAEKSTACVQWFQKATDHCSAVLDGSEQTIVERLLSYVVPSYRYLNNFKEITEIDTDTLSEADCKLLLSKMARDYITREPHYKLAGYTVLALWTLLCLIVAIISLIAIGVIYNRFSGKLKGMLNINRNLTEEETEDDDNAKEEPQLNLATNETKIEEVLRYDILDTEEKALNTFKKIAADPNTSGKAILKSIEEITTTTFERDLVETMKNTDQAVMGIAKFETTHLDIDCIKPLTHATDRIVNSIYL